MLPLGYLRERCCYPKIKLFYIHSSKKGKILGTSVKKLSTDCFSNFKWLYLVGVSIITVILVAATVAAHYYECKPLFSILKEIILLEENKCAHEDLIRQFGRKMSYFILYNPKLIFMFMISKWLRTDWHWK